MPVAFIHINGSEVSSIIEKVYNDTIYIKQYDVRMFPTPRVTRVEDTARYYDLRFHYNEIAAIPVRRKGLNLYATVRS